MTELKEIMEELYALREENQDLKLDNDFLQRQNSALKIRCSKYSQEITSLESQVADMEFTSKMTADLEEEKAIRDGEKFYYEQGIALYGDDF